MTKALQRITTEYIDTEDRVRISGELAEGDPLVIWLTQRLLQRLVPALLQWLDQQDTDTLCAEVLQSWEQQAARAELKAQPPVHLKPNGDAWLAQAIDITPATLVVTLVFRGDGGQRAMLSMAVKPLRQWLNIVHDAFVIADWPPAVWPEWIRENAMPMQGQIAVLH